MPLSNEEKRARKTAKQRARRDKQLQEDAARGIKRRPRGHAPIGKRWDTDTGDWVVCGDCEAVTPITSAAATSSITPVETIVEPAPPPPPPPPPRSPPRRAEWNMGQQCAWCATHPPPKLRDYSSRAEWDAVREPWYATLMGEPMPPYGDNARRTESWRVSLKRHERSLRRLEAWKTEPNEKSARRASVRRSFDNTMESTSRGFDTLVTAASHAMRMDTSLSALQLDPMTPPPLALAPAAATPAAAAPTAAALAAAAAPSAAAPAAAAPTAAAPMQSESTSAAEVANLDEEERREQEAAWSVVLNLDEEERRRLEAARSVVLNLDEEERRKQEAVWSVILFVHSCSQGGRKRKMTALSPAHESGLRCAELRQPI